MASYSDRFAVILVLAIAFWDILSAERIYNSTGSIVFSNRNNAGQQLESGRRDWVNINIPNQISSTPSSTSASSTARPQNSGRRDFVNTNVPTRPQNPPSGPQDPQNNHQAPQSNQQRPQSNQQRPQTNQQGPQNNQWGPQNAGSAPTNSGNRDWVNPAFGNQRGATTPWPALGSRGGQGPPANKQAPPSWVRPSGPPKPPSQNAQMGGVSLADVLKVPSHNPGWNTPVSTTAKLPSAGPSQPSRTSPALPTQDMGEDSELKEFSEALLKKDVNNAAQYVTINYQGKTSSGSKDDKAPKPLLDIQQEAYSIPTVSKLVQLHNNYILETTESEYATPQEKGEENALLDAVLATSIMQQTRNFLIEKAKISKDPKDFRDIMKTIWFNMYARGSGKISSSGFEHVFLAEIKNREVSGLHNWIYFNDQEAKHKANYLGFLKTLDLGNKGAIVKYHFTFSNIDKPVGSMFIGTSPELEMALYTTCFLVRPDRPCPMRLNGHDFVIRTYTYRYRGKNMIGSAFPEI